LYYKKVLSLTKQIITLKINKMRKLKVNTKLTIRKVNRLDNIDKTGLAIGVLFILPACATLLINVIVNGSNML